MNKQGRVFISYAHSDKDWAMRISNALSEKGIEVWNDSFYTEDYLFDKLQYIYESSDHVLVLISKYFDKSAYQGMEISSFLQISKRRKISIIPILIETTKMPDIFLNSQVVNISKDFNKGISRIYDKLKILPDINLEHLSPIDFTNFVYDLLKEYGFKDLTWQYSDHVDFGFDLMGSYWNSDPFGFKIEEKWLIEIKFYHQERFSINAINKLIELYNRNRSPYTKVLLVTNGILSSVVEDYLKEIQSKEHIPISILDGSTIKKLVIRRKKIVTKYFTK